MSQKYQHQGYQQHPIYTLHSVQDSARVMLFAQFKIQDDIESTYIQYWLLYVLALFMQWLSN